MWWFSCHWLLFKKETIQERNHNWLSIRIKKSFVDYPWDYCNEAKKKKKFKAICVCVCDTIKKFDPKTTTTLVIFKNIVQSICVIARQWHKSIENMTSNIIHYWSNHCSFKFIALFWNFFAYFEFDHSIRISVDWFLILLVSIWTNLMIVFNSSKIKWQLDDRIYFEG